MSDFWLLRMPGRCNHSKNSPELSESSSLRLTEMDSSVSSTLKVRLWRKWRLRSIRVLGKEGTAMPWLQISPVACNKITNIRVSAPPRYESGTPYAQ